MDEYGTPLFHDIDYQPVYTYKPFIPRKCTLSWKEHIQPVRYFAREICINCKYRRMGKRADSICHCEY